MLREQPAPESGDSGLDARITLRFKRKVAFRIQAHRAIVQIGGADAEQFIVDYDDLGMDVDALIIETGYTGFIKTQTVMAVGREQPLEQALAQHVHRVLRQPADGVFRQQYDNFGSVFLLQPSCQRITYLACRKIL